MHPRSAAIVGIAAGVACPLRRKAHLCGKRRVVLASLVCCREWRTALEASTYTRLCMANAQLSVDSEMSWPWAIVSLVRRSQANYAVRITMASDVRPTCAGSAWLFLRPWSAAILSILSIAVCFYLVVHNDHTCNRSAGNCRHTCTPYLKCTSSQGCAVTSDTARAHTHTHTRFAPYYGTVKGLYRQTVEITVLQK